MCSCCGVRTRLGRDLRRWIVAVALLLGGSASDSAAQGDDGCRPTHAAHLHVAHAHNDYWHTRPLHDALAHGFQSVEVDVHLRDDTLFVAHDANEIRSGRTLQALYLDPLRERIRACGGQVYRALSEAATPRPLWLLIDVKTAPGPTYDALRQALASYAGMLTTVRIDATGNARLQLGTVTVLLSGNRPVGALLDALARTEHRLLTVLDGRPRDLGRAPAREGHRRVPPILTPLISASLADYLVPSPDGAALDTAAIRTLSERAAAYGHPVRLWGTPDTPAAWSRLQALGVGVLQTDDLGALVEWLETPRE